MSLIVYADFSSPDCYLASRRADALAAVGLPVDWRAVEQRPRLPVTGVPTLAADQQAVTARFAELEGVLLPGERLPWTMPGFVPRTEAVGVGLCGGARQQGGRRRAAAAVRVVLARGRGHR